MRRTASLISLVALLGALLGALPARAHATIRIAGFQFAWNDGFGFGVAGFLSTPAGPVPYGDPPINDVLGSVVNHDLVQHTFTRCEADFTAPESCDFVEPGEGFDVVLDPLDPLDPLKSAGIGLRAPGTVYFSCRIHPWMRGAMTLTGEV